MTKAQSTPFMVMTDEHVANAIYEQLRQRGVDIVRLIDRLPTGTPDPDVLEYCHQQGYALITLDERIQGHIKARLANGDDHAGVFIGHHHLQGPKGIGTIVSFIAFYHDMMQEGAATVEDDVYNLIIFIR